MCGELSPTKTDDPGAKAQMNFFCALHMVYRLVFICHRFFVSIMIYWLVFTRNRFFVVSIWCVYMPPFFVSIMIYQLVFTRNRFLL